MIPTRRCRGPTWLAQLAGSVATQFKAEWTRACRDVRRTAVGLDFSWMPTDTPDTAGQFLDEPDDTGRRLRAALEQIPERDRRILVERFGLDGHGERRLETLDPAITR